MPVTKGIREQNRRLLDKLHRAATGPFTADEAAEMLSVSRGRAQRLLPYLASRGWLARIRRGTYTTVPLGAASPSEWREDPWIVAHDAFAPCYIGGWSACEHWELSRRVRIFVWSTRQGVKVSIVRASGFVSFLR